VWSGCWSGTWFGTVEPGQLLAASSAGETAGRVYLGALDTVAVPLAHAALAGPGRAVRTSRRSPRWPLGWPVPAERRCSATRCRPSWPRRSVVALADGQPAALASTSDGARQLVLAGPELAVEHGGLGSADGDRAVA